MTTKTNHTIGFHATKRREKSIGTFERKGTFILKQKIKKENQEN